MDLHALERPNEEVKVSKPKVKLSILRKKEGGGGRKGPNKQRKGKTKQGDQHNEGTHGGFSHSMPCSEISLSEAQWSLVEANPGVELCRQQGP